MRAFVGVDFGASGAGALFVAVLASRVVGPAVVIEPVLLSKVLDRLWW